MLNTCIFLTISLKNYIKNKIIRIKRLEDLTEMIKIAIYINNKVYK
jgi:hypothetical protein